MLKVVCETIILTKFGSLLEGRPPPKMAPKNETFELLNIESRNSECRKLYMRQLFWPNLGVLRGGQTLKMALPKR